MSSPPLTDPTVPAADTSVCTAEARKQSRYVSSRVPRCLMPRMPSMAPVPDVEAPRMAITRSPARALGPRCHPQPRQHHADVAPHLPRTHLVARSC